MLIILPVMLCSGAQMFELLCLNFDCFIKVYSFVSLKLQCDDCSIRVYLKFYTINNNHSGCSIRVY